jgi:hypothetical protein
MSDCDIPAAGNPNHFAPDEITIYGVKLNTGQAYGKIDLGGNEAPLTLQLSVASGNKTLPPGEVAIVAAYGYAFEGHCYRFDKPKILLFEYDGLGFIAQGCGFDPPTPPPGPAPGPGPGPAPYRPYSMWRIKSQTRILELGMSIDSAQTLILDASLPGKRPPNTYSALMQVAHRGGRLTGS